MSIEFRELAKRIRAAKDNPTLHKLEKSCFNIYNAGLLTPREFMRLDVLIMEKLALI